MRLPRHVHRVAIGLALFSMFFGSGNLIFPLAIGTAAGDQAGWAMGGFLISGVLLPFLGVLSMVAYKGDYHRFFAVIGERWGSLLTFALLTAWIPLGSGPRCVMLAYANMKPYLGEAPLWAFSAIYCLLLLSMTVKRGRILDLLGYVLTPLLLLCLGILLYSGAMVGEGWQPTLMTASGAFTKGLLEGYNTMDLIAAFFFASTVIRMLREAGADGKHGHDTPLKLASKASIVSVALLGSVYMGLIGVSAANGSSLMGLSKDGLLAALAHKVLDPKLCFIASLAASVACLTTSIALTVVYADYFHHHVFKKPKAHFSILSGTVVITFVISLLGFTGICRISEPLMQVFYPTLIVLMIWNMAISPFLKRAGARELRGHN